ncbi:MAG: hypothetical protein NTZ56_06590 [Acidobacteria bacterium]|nr:hypothetical protein [Acidobacteriota bacterium]
MLKDTLRSWFGQSGEAAATAPALSLTARAPKALPAPYLRTSHALEQFFQDLSGREGLRILDLSGASQANLNFLMQYGHQLYCEDFVSTMETVFGNGPAFYENQANEALMEQFLEQTFASLHGPFDGALVWDTLQFLQPPLLDHAVGHLNRLMEPQSLIYSFFCSSDKLPALPVNSYRLETNKSIRVIPRGELPMSQIQTNRGIERTFSDFNSVKFFLTREHLREVLVRR